MKVSVLHFLTVFTLLATASLNIHAYPRCADGFVWREAFVGDYVCVSPESRDQAKKDNSLATSRVAPGGGAYGPDTCKQGFVWREARPSDHVCVEPRIRAQIAKENQLAADRVSQAAPPATPSTQAPANNSTSQQSADTLAASGDDSFWSSLEGILTALAGVIAAITALVVAIRKKS